MFSAYLSYRPRYLPTLLMLLLFSLAVGVNAQQSLLELNRALEQQLSGKQVHDYKVRLGVGEYLHITLEQKGIDIK